MTVNNANADQISFIINLMHGYDESKLLDIKAIKNEFFYNTVLVKAKKVFLNTRENPRREIKSFFPPKFKEYLPKDQQSVFLNAVNVYNDRNKIIKLFEDKNIMPSNYSLDPKSE